MDFFEAQDRALHRSRRLVLLFGLAVITMMAVVYVTVVLVLDFAPIEGRAATIAAPADFIRPEVALAVIIGMTAVIGGGTAFRTAQLRRGGPAVAELLGGRRVDPATQDERERTLLNVVEEMAVASGLVVPAVYVLDGEAGINAFAAGHSPADATVAVTRGALDTLTRDELQGVVGHEFSHILNGDMRLNVRLIGLLFGILLLAIVGRGLLRGSMGGPRYRSAGGRKGSGAQIAVLGVVLIALGYLGVLFGRLIQAAVSRQREFLADAAAVQFTRNPDGLAGALTKIAEASGGSRIRNHHAQEAGHLFFATGIASGLSRLTSTHPPLEERIRRIDPQSRSRLATSPRPASRPAPAQTVPRGTRPAFPLPFPMPGRREAAAVLGFAGGGQLAYARQLLENVPDAARTAVRTPDGAIAIVCALLLESDAGVRAPQLDRIARALGEPTAREAAELRDTLEPRGPAVRLPLLELALPALRDLPKERAAALRSTITALIRNEGRARAVDLAVANLVQRSIQATLGEQRPKSGTLPLARLRDEAELVLSLVAHATAGPEEAAAKAFGSGEALLPSESGPWRLQPQATLDVARLNAALDRLAGAAPGVRRILLEAAAATVQADEHVSLEEIELLRMLAETLDVPLPPVPIATAEERADAGEQDARST